MYFHRQSHGFNLAHWRMPSIATDANAANRGLVYVGVSGDGDSLSIGLGQLCHAIRRNLDMLYVIVGAGMYEINGTVSTPLVDLPFEALCPGSKALEELQKEFR